VEPIISDLPAAGWPACGRQGEDYMCAVRLRRIEVSPLRPPCPRAPLRSEASEAGEAGSEASPLRSEASRKGKAIPGHTHEVWVGLEGASIPHLRTR